MTGKGRKNRVNPDEYPYTCQDRITELYVMKQGFLMKMIAEYVSNFDIWSMKISRGVHPSFNMHDSMV